MKLEDHTYDTLMKRLLVRRGRQWIPFSRGDTLSLIRHFFRSNEERGRLKGKLAIARMDLRAARKTLRRLEKAGIHICKDGTIEIQGSFAK